MQGFMSVSSSKVGDIEQGTLYPGITYGESELRWGFIHKVYGILTAQILLTTLISSITVTYAPLNELLRGNSGILFLFAILPFVLMVPLYIYQQKHPLNFVFLGLFTACLSVTVSVACANTDGRIVLQALILTSAVVCSLTAYTFWAAKKGKDFSYLGPILFTCLMVLILTGFMQDLARSHGRCSGSEKEGFICNMEYGLVTVCLLLHRVGRIRDGSWKLCMLRQLVWSRE